MGAGVGGGELTGTWTTVAWVLWLRGWVGCVAYGTGGDEYVLTGCVGIVLCWTGSVAIVS